MLLLIFWILSLVGSLEKFTGILALRFDTDCSRQFNFNRYSISVHYITIAVHQIPVYPSQYGYDYKSFYLILRKASGMLCQLHTASGCNVSLETTPSHAYIPKMQKKKCNVAE